MGQWHVQLRRHQARQQPLCWSKRRQWCWRWRVLLFGLLRCVASPISLEALVSRRWLWRACAAASGWDPASGLGSPVFGNLSATLLGARYTKGSCTVDGRACSQAKTQTTTNLASQGETATAVEWSASAFQRRRVLVSVTETCPSGLVPDDGWKWWHYVLFLLGCVVGAIVCVGIMVIIWNNCCSKDCKPCR